MTNKNTSKDMHKNAPKGHNPGQPEPLSGSKSEEPKPHKTEAQLKP